MLRGTIGSRMLFVYLYVHGFVKVKEVFLSVFIKQIIGGAMRRGIVLFCFFL